MRSDGRRHRSFSIKLLVGCLAVLALTACGSLSPTVPHPAGDPSASVAQSPDLPPLDEADPSQQEADGWAEPSEPAGSPASPVASRGPDPGLEPGVSLVRGPYLQSVTDHSVIVVWKIDQPRDGQVAYGEAGSLRSRAVDRAIAVDHAITLDGLKPYTLYSYRIESEGAPISAEYSFRTAPDRAQTEFSFVVFGDTRSQHSVHQAVAARIEMLEPDFVIHTGDLVDDGRREDQWETFFEIEQAVLSRAPLFPAMGNHEEGADHYFDLFNLPGNERWYSLAYGRALFIFLQIDGYGSFDSESEQYAWLQRTLASNALPWVFVAFHVPPFSSLREEALEVSIRETLTPLFEQHGVDVVFNGHHHDYQRAIVNGVTYVITGGGGAPIYDVTRADAHLIAHKNAYHVLYVKVSEDEVTAVGVTPEGEEFDRFSIAESVIEGSR